MMIGRKLLIPALGSGLWLLAIGNSSAESRRIEVDGATLHVEVDGKEGAPAILMWNGAGCTTHMWDKVVRQLSDRFRTIRFDVRPP